MSIGIWQIVLVGLVLALLFGSHKIPALAAEAAKGLKSLKREVAKAKTPDDSADAPFDEGEADRKR
jgi:sec-independent protein translocase protein TatA